MIIVNTVQRGINAETKLWQQRVLAVGGSLKWDSAFIANNFINAIKNKSYYRKIVYLLPMLGANVDAAKVPLIDTLNVGAATNVNFVNSDFNQSTGLQGDGSTKYLNTLVKPSQLGSSNNGGLGFWENNISFGANVEPMGCYSADASNRYVLDIRNVIRGFRWGAPANSAIEVTAAINGHYYGQRSSSTSRAAYLNAVSIATNSTSDVATGAGDTNIAVVGALEPGAFPWPGRCALAYMTNGTMNSDEIVDFDSVLRRYLLGATGKPLS